MNNPDFLKMLEDQTAFNHLIFNRLDAKEPELKERLRHLGLGLVEEVLEFLRTFDYKVHRRQKLRLQNTAHSHEELIDIFKYWLSLAELNDFPFERLEELYFAKSRVVRYRYQEEWVATLDRRCVVVDIDQVLGDYICAICTWGIQNIELLDIPKEDRLDLVARLRRAIVNSHFVGAQTLGVPYMEWQKVKHDFRIRGGKRTLPVFSDAHMFLSWCRAMGWAIVLVTSRPVTEYPNIFTDTIAWLHDNSLPYDYLWWADRKTERIFEGGIKKEQIVFAVDDSLEHVQSYEAAGIRAYCLQRNAERSYKDAVGSLHELMEKERGNGTERRQA